jgi:hypothetical protein
LANVRGFQRTKECFIWTQYCSPGSGSTLNNLKIDAKILRKYSSQKGKIHSEKEKFFGNILRKWRIFVGNLPK